MDGSKQQAHATGQDNDNDNAWLHGTLPAIQTVNKPLLCSRGYSVDRKYLIFSFLRLCPVVVTKNRVVWLLHA